MAEEEKIDIAEPAESPVADSLDGAEGRLAELEQALATAETKAEENWNKVVAAHAEMENLRKRTLREVENARQFGLEKFASELLPVRDSLEMGISAAEGVDSDAEKVREGMELTLKMLAAAMEKFGVAQVDPMGVKFDPQFHEAISMMESAEAEPNSVVAVIQKGYTLNERLLRPARVVVAKAPAAPPPEAASIDIQA